MTAMSLVCIHQAGKPIHLDATIFKLDELTLDPFITFEMAPTVMAEYRMSHPSEDQYTFVLSVTNEAIQAGKSAPLDANRGADSAEGAEANAANREEQALKRQAVSLALAVKAAVEATTKNSSETNQSRTDREATKAVADSIFRYQLMLAHLEDVQDPHEPDIKVVTVVLPEISPIFNNVLESSKLPDAVRMMKE